MYNFTENKDIKKILIYQKVKLLDFYFQQTKSFSMMQNGIIQDFKTGNLVCERDLFREIEW